MDWNHQWAQGEAQEAKERKDPLAIFKEAQQQTEVKPDMRPEQVADIWSDKLMQIISTQMGTANKSSRMHL